MNVMKLLYNKPASTWTEALPIGNGRVGAMVFGGIEKEYIPLNEDTLWSGGPKDANNSEAQDVLPMIQKLIREEKYEEADQLSKKMMGPYTQAYLPFGDINIHFHHDNHVAYYVHTLNLDSAVASVTYKVGHTNYKREYFTSFSYQVFIIIFVCYTL